MINRFFFIFVLIPVFSLAQVQPSEAELEANIVQIKQKLKVLKTTLNKAYGEEKQLLIRLEEQDKSINTVAQAIQEGKKQLEDIQQKITTTTEKIDQYTTQIADQKQQITDLLKLHIYLNHDKTLKMLLLNPKNQHTDQTKHQIKYLQNKLFQLIKEVALQVKELQAFKNELIVLQDQAQIKQQKLITQQHELVAQRNERLNILKALKKEIAKYEAEDKSLSKDQKRLQKLLDEIQLLLSDLPKDLGTNKPFAQLKKRLKKPISGKYIRSFKSSRSENTRWDGVVLAGDMGDQVKAVAYGRVAFADWLRGFGMLVILDHQDGYMSLYGFNESINVEVGDWVNERQNIATVGNSGTLPRPALYFEIRKDAKPLNPKSWLK